MNGSTRVSGRVRAAFAVLVIVASLTLTGCDAEQVGAAAVVGGSRITVEQVQAGVEDLRKVNREVPADEAHRRVLGELIRARVVEEAAARRGVSVEPGEVRRLIDSLVQNLGGQQQFEAALAATENDQLVGPASAQAWARRQVLAREIARSLVPGKDTDPAVQQRRATEFQRFASEVAADLHIEVNPRYGRWDPDTGIAPLPSGGLAKPAGAG